MGKMSCGQTQDMLAGLYIWAGLMLEKTAGGICLHCCSRDPDSDKWQKIDGSLCCLTHFWRQTQEATPGTAFIFGASTVASLTAVF